MDHLLIIVNGTKDPIRAGRSPPALGVKSRLGEPAADFIAEYKTPKTLHIPLKRIT
jgi:hypothetical protein